MKIQFFKRAAGPNFNYGVGTVADLPKEIAEELIRAGSAEAYKGRETATLKHGTERGVPEAPRQRPKMVPKEGE